MPWPLHTHPGDWVRSDLNFIGDDFYDARALSSTIGQPTVRAFSVHAFWSERTPGRRNTDPFWGYYPYTHIVCPKQLKVMICGREQVNFPQVLSKENTSNCCNTGTLITSEAFIKSRAGFKISWEILSYDLLDVSKSQGSLNIQATLKLTGAPAALLVRRLSNFSMVGQFYGQTLQLWDLQILC